MPKPTLRQRGISAAVARNAKVQLSGNEATNPENPLACNDLASENSLPDPRKCGFVARTNIEYPMQGEKCQLSSERLLA